MISPSVPWKYDVFLSFRGADTRKSFTDHLYAALIRSGITVFKDHESLKRGKNISSEICKAIEESRNYAVIFSGNYASSTWCLNELVKIVECMEEEKEKTVLPIFYHVAPSVIRRQAINLDRASDRDLEEEKEKRGRWREALMKVANCSGFNLGERHESEFIHDIVKEVSGNLNRLSFMNHEDLVGVKACIEDLMMHLNVGVDDVRMVGIYGIGGIGKTTIARVVYELISSEFEGSCFLSNVRLISEKGSLISLQRQLLYQILKDKNYDVCNVYDGVREISSRLQYKKVLIVIDDVVHVEQLNFLAGNHYWFGSGSRIIITTRDKHLLMTNGVNYIYKVEELKDDDALQLFSLKAFKNCQPLEDYLELSKYVVKYAGGLPLALKVLGSFLFDRTIDEWKCALDRLKRHSEKEILDTLQISFDGLKETEKDIFLDIACFFRGENIDYVTRILDGCGLNAGIGMRVLLDKSLITISNDILGMHDLLQEMGRQIVKRESPKEPGKRSRLWEEEDIYHVLTENTGAKVVEGIMLNLTTENVHLSAKAFLKMVNLRLLKVLNVQLPEGLEYLSNKLRLLEWHGYSLKSLPSNLQLDKLVELKMHHSCVEQLWQGTKHLNQLESISLSHSKNYKKMPDFTWLPNLKELILEECTRLCEIHPTLTIHKKLTFLNLKGCKSLTTLGSKIDMKSLRELILSGCSKLKNFPEIVGNMECLSKLYLDGTSIKELSMSIGRLTGLVWLNLKDCNNLGSLPNNLNRLKRLKTLNLSGCTKVEILPDNLGEVECLEELDVSGTAIRKPVPSIFHLKNLKALSFRGCKGLPFKSWNLGFPLRLMQSCSNSTPLILSSFSSLCSLIKLDLSDCSLGEGAIPNDFDKLSSLQELHLSKNNFISLPTSISRLSKLQHLQLEGCKRLQFLPELPSSINAVRLDACASLETISYQLQSCNSEWLVVSCMNCWKLIDCNNIPVTMLAQYLKTMSNPRNGLSIVVPGSEIPKWFKYQDEKSSIRIKNPEMWDDDNKLMGYAVCSAFVVHEHSPALSDAFGTHKLFCYLKADGEVSSTSHFIHFEEIFGQNVSHHLWFFYISYHEYFEEEWRNKYSNIEFSFVSEWGAGLEVKRCAIRPIYEKDLHQSMNL